jgi:hypothetical protein
MKKELNNKKQKYLMSKVPQGAPNLTISKAQRGIQAARSKN